MHLLPALCRQAGHQQPRRRGRMFGQHAANHRTSRVVGVLDNEGDFVIVVVLAKQRAEVLFQRELGALAWGQDHRPAQRPTAVPVPHAGAGVAAVFPRLQRQQHRLHHGHPRQPR